MKKRIKLLLLIIIGNLLCTQYVFAATNKPITWEQKSLDVAVDRGETKEIDLKFKSNKDLSNVDLWLVPELQPYIGILNNHFSSVTTNTDNTVHLTISANCNDTIGSHDGTLHVRSNNQTLPLTLPLRLNITDLAFPSSHIIEIPRVEPNSIFINQETLVTFTIQIVPVPELDFLNVHLLRINRDNSINDLGRLYDDGTHGDLLPGDSTFTSQVTLNEMVPGYMRLKAVIPYTDTQCPLVSDEIVINIRVVSDPEHVRTQLANELRSGDLVDAQKRFSSSEKNLIIQTLPAETLSKLADAIEGAQLIKDKGSVRIYETNWQDDNKILRKKFTMAQNEIGEWIIVGW